MAKVLEKLGNVLAGGGRLDLDSLKVANDPEVVEARHAEDHAARRAQEAEAQLPDLAAQERGKDAAYDAAAAEGAEAGVRAARSAWISASEAVRGAKESLVRLQRAAVAARKKREEAEVQAERRVAGQLRDRLAANIAATRRLVDQPGGMLQLAAEREALGAALDRLTPWGSPAARRLGSYGGLGGDAQALCCGRTATGRGAHTVTGVFLVEDGRQGGSDWELFLKAARNIGLLEG